MPKYKESDYSLSYALQNIGDYFWRLYRDDLKAYATNRARKDIPQRIHDEWDRAAQCSPFGTDIRIEWALAIYDHGDWEKALSTAVPSYNQQQNANVKVDPRRRYPAEYRGDNGVYVRSVSELCIANWLYANRIPFEYERSVTFSLTKETAHCDFYLPDQDVYIEFWGMSNDPAYEKYKRWKEENYLRNKLRLVSLYPSDLKNLRDRLDRCLQETVGTNL